MPKQVRFARTRIRSSELNLCFNAQFAAKTRSQVQCLENGTDLFKMFEVSSLES